MNLSLPFFGRSKSIVGLDVGSSVVKAVQLSSKGRGNNFELTHLGVAPVPPESIVQGAFLNAAAISAAIREAVDSAGITSTQAAVAVSGNSVIVKRVHMPAMSPEQLHEQIGWEAEQYIPFDVNEVNLDFQILEPDAGDGQMEILLVAAKRDLIDDYVQVVAEAGLTLAAIDVASFALGNAFEANYESEGSDVVALVNVGAQVVNINVVSEGLPAFTRDISTAGNQYTEEIQKTLSVSFDEAERLKLGAGGGAGQEMLPQEVDHAMRAVTESVVGEIGRSLDFFAASSVESRISRVLLSGGTSRVAGFEEAFRERSGVPVEVMNPLTRMLPSSRFDQDFLDSVAPSLGVGVGLALREVSA